GLVSEVFESTDWLAGPGDDGAVVTEAGMSLVVGGEAILPSFVAADPYGAGVAAVTTNLNDLAAMGAWPLALVDTVTGPREIIRQVLEGMRWASGLYQVPVVGGHLTVTAGPPGLSAFGLGLVGSLAMLLECNRLGVSLDLDALPVPAGVTLERWITCFPCLSFLLCVPPGREDDCLHAFGLRGLAAATVGTLDDTGLLRLSS